MTMPVLEDSGIPFMIDGTDLHGMLVRLGKEGQQILDRQQAPSPPIDTYAGQLLALTAAIYGSPKRENILSLAVNGSGAISQLLADARLLDETAREIALRGTLSLNDTVSPPPSPSFQQWLQEGYLVLSIDHGAGIPRSQGIVALTGDSLEQAMVEYFTQSTQERAQCRLAANPSPKGGYAAASLLLRQLPQQDHQVAKINEEWRWAQAMIHSLRDEELLDGTLAGETLLNRLFHEYGVRIFPAWHYVDHCTCSREKMLNVLNNLEPQQRTELIAPSGKFESTCLFCKTTHLIAPDELVKFN